MSLDLGHSVIYSFHFLTNGNVLLDGLNNKRPVRLKWSKYIFGHAEEDLIQGTFLSKQVNPALLKAKTFNGCYPSHRMTDSLTDITL